MLFQSSNILGAFLKKGSSGLSKKLLTLGLTYYFPGGKIIGQTK